MRIVMWSVTAFALATTIDTYHYDGRWMQTVARLIVNLWVHLW